VKTIMNDGDPWSPVDTSATNVEPEAPLEVKGGHVTAHINLGSAPAEEEQPSTEEEEVPAEEDTSQEVEDAEAALAEKLAALDAAKSGKKTKR
jgi:hypothetical protein